MLQAAVDELRDALGARVVYGFSVARDGELHNVAVSPREHPRPANIAPRDYPESVSLLCKGTAGVLDSWSEAECPECEALFVPWWSEDGPVGAALALVDEVPDATALKLASAHGASVGSRMAAERYFGSQLSRLGMLEQLSDLLETAFNATSDSIVQVDLDGVITRWNPAAEALYGWSAREVLGRPLIEVDENWLRFACTYIREVASSGAPTCREIVQRDRLGAAFAVEMTFLPMCDETGSISHVLMTSRPSVHASAKVDRMSTTDLTDVIVRELTGPLTAIIGYTELLSRSAISEDPGQRLRVTRGLRDRCEELTRLLEDLMLLSRLDSKALQPEPVDLAELCRTLVDRDAAQNCRGFGSTSVSGEGLALADRRSAEAGVKGLLRCLAEHCTPGADIGFTISGDSTKTTIRIDALEREAAATADLTERFSQLAAGVGVEASSLGFRLAALVAEAHGGNLTVAPTATPGPSFTLELPAHLPVGTEEEERWNSTMM
jgi:PAS domain S-box-containing protein